MKFGLAQKKKKKKNLLVLTSARGYTCRYLKAKPVELQMRAGVLCNFIEKPSQRAESHKAPGVFPVEGSPSDQACAFGSILSLLPSLYIALTPTRNPFPTKVLPLPHRSLQEYLTSNWFSCNHPKDRPFSDRLSLSFITSPVQICQS